MSASGAAGKPAPVFIALVALTLVAPLPLGAYPAWAWASMSAICGALLLCWAVSVLTGRVSLVAPPPFLRWSGTALGLALFWGLLQTVEFTPADWHHPIWRDAAEALDTPLNGSVSLNPAAGRDSLLRMAMYAGVFWLAFQYGRDVHRAGFALSALAAGAACYALFGLVVLYSGADSVLWLDKTVYAGAATGTFVNPNSFGAYCGIGLLCATSALLLRFSDGVVRIGFRERLRYLLVEFMPRNTLLLAAWLLLACALPLSLSRGANASTVLALLALFLLLALRRGMSFLQILRRLILGVLATTLLLLADQALERRLWDIGPDFASRAEIYTQSLTAIGERPLLGTGLGTFEAVYRSHRTPDVRPGVSMAHNDYLELALELGIPAAALFVVSLLTLSVGCARGVRARRRNFEIPAVGVATCVLAGAHSLIDFSMQIPAFAAAFSLVLGVAVAQTIPTGGGGGGGIATSIHAKRSPRREKLQPHTPPEPAMTVAS